MHTPGQWTLHQNRNHLYAKGQAGVHYHRTMQACFYIAGPQHDSDFVADVVVTAGPADGYANARLIAAAADLLEAAQSALGVCEALELSGVAQRLPGFASCLADLKAAITKATKEDPQL